MARADVIQVLRQAVSGERGSLFAEPMERYPICISSAPGRLDVLGGLGVRVGGTVAQMALPVRMAVAVQLTDEPVLKIFSERMQGAGESAMRLALPVGLLAVNDEAAWAAPVAAMWRVLGEANPAGGGLRGGSGGVVLIHGAVPMGAGQASSTALLTALALGVRKLEGVPADAAEVAGLVRRAQELCGRGGEGAVIDAMTCLLADEPVGAAARGGRGGLLRYSSQPCELVGHVPLPENLRVLAMDTGVRSTSAGAVLEELRVAGAMGLAIIETIYRDLGQAHTPLHGYLANTSPLLYRQYFRALLPRRLRGSDFARTYGSQLGVGLDPGGMYRVRTAVDHLIAENEHAEQFLQAIEELSERSVDGRPAMRDAEERQRTQQRAGRLALASHHSYRLRLELSCAQADWIVDRLMQAGPERGIYGGRITGVGGGGTVMALVERSPAAGEAVLEIMEGYLQMTGLPLAVIEAGGAGSAGAMFSNASG